MARSLAAMASALLFAGPAALFLPLTGLHTDAAEELACLLPCTGARYIAEGWGHRIPIMVISYLGALKSWVYQPLFALGGVSIGVVRIPNIVIGALTILLFVRMLTQPNGAGAGLMGGLLLATDPSFILATVYDFGPIAFSHCFLMGGIALLMRFARTQGLGALGAAFLLFGLGLWHKAVFVWPLGGVACAALAAFRTQIAALLTPARVAVAAVAFLFGSAPLWYYNIAQAGGTFQVSSIPYPRSAIAQKAQVLQATLDGSAFLGFLTADEGKLPATLALPLYLISACVAVWMFFTPARRQIVFVSVALTVTWIQMVLLPTTGGAVHHTILLWPFPQYLAALALTALARWKGFTWAALVVVLVAASNLAMLHQYHSLLTNRGPAPLWTQATGTLAEHMTTHRQHRYFATDWGFSPVLCLLTRGAVPLWDISFDLLKPTAEFEASAATWVRDPEARFLAYVEGERFAGNRQRLASIAARFERTPRVVEMIRDPLGRDMFEVLRFSPALETATRFREVIPAGDPAFAGQLSGFHEIEHGEWRWTRH